MIIYVEYAFIENFLFDFILLLLARLSANAPLYWWRLVFSACMGALFALFFPLLSLSIWLGMALKISMGFLLCLFTCARLKTRKEWGRYALIATFFFVFAFGFGGALLSFFFNFQGEGGGVTAGKGWIWLGFALLTIFSRMLIRKIYERKRLYEKIYDCIVSFGQSTRRVKGFLDSGNLVKKGNLLVCFLASDIFYQLVPVEFLEEGVGQVCDEIQFMTMAGEKKTKVYEGEICVEGRKKRVYYAPSVHMIGREYDVILHGEIMEDRE